VKIGIIGAGAIGSILARHLRRLQHTVWIANSRGPETLGELARETGAIPVHAVEAANGVDLLVLTIPLKGVPSLPKELLARLPATSPIIDTGNYYPIRDGRIREIDAGTVESEWTTSILGRPVIKVFNNIVADSLMHKGVMKNAKNRIALPIAGDSAVQKQIVMALVDSLGFDAIDAGPLSNSWRYQPGTPAYCADPNIQQLPQLLQRADRGKSPMNRDNAAKLLGDLVFTLPQQELVRMVRLSAGLDTFQPRSWIALLSILSAVIGSRLRGPSKG
jgi:8-hydroxy-5-deazaflavin:NADPH oxidoreductase